MNDTRADERKPAVAWAVASTSNPRQAFLGISASAWIISYDGWQTVAVNNCLTSKEPNRHQWYANVKSILGVIETVEDGADVTIYTPEKTIADLYPTGWRRSNGTEAVAFDAAQDLYRVAAEKRLTVRLVFQSPDDRAKNLTKSAKAQADARYNELSDAELWAAPIAPNAKNKRGKRLAFPALTKGSSEVDDY
ncbi:hypothetical protein VQ02_14885 [Methylobacterium variabile]|jgi:hypothetical protein|uniref:RNase H type-1 domain-containing protein n=1 Tax=Methylobacterium variabile TaxID=298794 RepID=A0A0J6SSI5_9HYPH|nr:hypothetical protein [Methylobacterium variabile]KMO36659.1 hypothetical protein VQ02_14885 [Methylobacterium variabile]